MQDWRVGSAAVKALAVPARDLRLVPSTYDGQLTIVCNSGSGGSDSSASMDT